MNTVVSIQWWMSRYWSVVYSTWYALEDDITELDDLFKPYDDIIGFCSLTSKK